MRRSVCLFHASGFEVGPGQRILRADILSTGRDPLCNRNRIGHFAIVIGEEQCEGSLGLSNAWSGHIFGKLPIVKVAGVQPVKSAQSTNYKPTFAIVSWIDRPASLTAAPAAASKIAPATGSTQVKAPAPQPDPVGDFG